VLNERRAKSLHYDTVTDVAWLHVVDAPGTVRTRTYAGTLLLDANGFLVGVDIDPNGADRVVVMLGPHEAVARTQDARVSVSTDSSGTVYEVRIGSARSTVRGGQPNPYVPA
jgi:hypothetical protein